MADSHLTYIGCPPSASPVGLFASCYDVYARSGGLQLGWTYTENDGRTWTAATCERPTVRKVARTRWEAATSLWPEESA